MTAVDRFRRMFRAWKTTAAQALGRYYGYVTDETLAVRVDGAWSPTPSRFDRLVARCEGHGPASTLGLRGRRPRASA